MKLFDYIAEKTGGIHDQIYKIKPVSQSTSLQAAINSYNNGFLQGTRSAGGKTYSDLNNYAPESITDHYASRMQARRIIKESTEARTISSRNNSYVVGRGLRLDPTPDHETIGITLEQRAEWSKDVKNRFHLWAKSKNSDVTGTNNFYQNMRFAHWQCWRDGEAFPRFNYSDDKELLNPLQIGFLDANQIRGDEFTFSSGPTSQDDGFIKDGNGKPTAAKIWVTDPKKPGSLKDVEIPFIDKKTGRPVLLHMFEPEYAGQTRGISKLTDAVSDFEKITGYITATEVKMENGASFNFVTENEQQDPSDMDISSINTASIGNVDKPEVTEDGVVSAENYYATCLGIPEAVLNETGVNVFGGRQGDKLKAVPDLAPPETSKEFTDSRFGFLSASMGMAPSVAKMEFKSSFTAGKAELGLQDKEAGIQRDDLESDFAQLAYFAWLSGEIGAGRIQALGWSDPIIRAAWLQSRWQAEPGIVLNPAQESSAAKTNIELGRIDLDTAAEDLNGSSGSSNRAKLVKQLEELPTDPFKLKEIEEITESDEDNDNEDEKK